MKLYSYFRSSAAYRVRIGLNLKQIEYQIIPVNLLKNEQRQADFKQIQPQGLVPCLKLDDGQYLSQSGAILSYLDVLHTEPKLMPASPFQAAKVRSFVDTIACDIHPICNLRVIQHLNHQFEATEQHKLDWFRKWIGDGFQALESMLESADYCFLGQPTLADIYLIPQVYNALRFNLDMSDYPNISRIYQHCSQLPAFVAASPENQIDAV